ALAARVIRPDARVKAEWLATIGDLQTKLPFSKVRAAMAVMYPAGQHALSELSAQQRLDTLGRVDQAAGPVFMRAYAQTMIPAACTPASVARLQAAIVKLPDLSTGTKRSLLVAHQEDARCVAIKKSMTIF
ncbi:MAG TPA: aminopeptidase N, partial [Duganella sp.]|nr:aminopeptidase N [Duganella sp.]